MKWLKRIILAIVSIYIVALGLDIFISNTFLKSNLFEGEYNFTTDLINENIREDLIIYGSSRSYVHINPKILDEELKLNSYNSGFNGQKIKLIKLRNEEVLKEIKPKNVIINLDINLLIESEVYNPEQFIPIMLFNKNKYDLVHEELNVNLLDLYFPLVRYLKYEYKDTDLKKELYKIYFYSNYNNLRRYKGFKGMDYPWKEQDLKPYEITLDSLSIHDLNTMIIDLKKVETNVILINSPEYITQIQSQKNRKEIIGLYNSIAQKYNIPFIDYSSDSINYKKELFYNSNHLNSKGADVFTKKLAQDIKPYLRK